MICNKLNENKIKDWLNNFGCSVDKKENINHLKNIFRLSEKDALRIYKDWKNEYMTAKIDVLTLIKNDTRSFDIKSRSSKIKIELDKINRNKYLDAIAYTYNVTKQQILLITSMREKKKDTVSISKRTKLDIFLVDLIIDRLRNDGIWTVSKGWCR